MKLNQCGSGRKTMESKQEYPMRTIKSTIECRFCNEPMPSSVEEIVPYKNAERSGWSFFYEGEVASHVCPNCRDNAKIDACIGQVVV